MSTLKPYVEWVIALKKKFSTQLFVLTLTWMICGLLFILSSSLAVKSIAVLISVLLGTLFLADLKNSLESFTHLRPDRTRPVDTQKIALTDFMEAANRMNEVLGELNGQVSRLQQEINEHQSIFSSMSEGLLALDVDGKVKYANTVAAEIFKRPMEEIQGRNIEECVRNSQIQDSLQNSLSSSIPTSQELPLYDQEERWLKIHTNPLVDRAQKQVGTIAVFSDVTQIKRLENLRREFVANVSHELRTPLTSIHGFAETLLNSANLVSEQKKQFLEIIYQHSGRLGTLIEDLLSLSQIERSEEENNIELKRQPLRNIIESAATVVQHQLQQNQTQLNVNFTAEPIVNANAPLLEQACINLLDNAIKYSGKTSHVNLTISTSGPWAVVSVADNGPGISAEHLPRIFERFYRVDRSRSRKMGGTGLGLAIVKHIVQSHHGRVDVRSELNKGSTFSFFIPLTQTA